VIFSWGGACFSKKLGTAKMRKAVLLISLLGPFQCVFAAKAQVPDPQVPRYDLLLKGGHVIDPANGLDAKIDVAVSLGRIAAVEKNIPANQAGKVVDVSGLYVTPGLIDIHYHIGHGGAPLNWFAPEPAHHEVLSAAALATTDPRAQFVPYGIPADLALQSGVTTIVDAGSAGTDTFLQEKEEVIDHAKVRVRRFSTLCLMA
jgi:dihydroorotase